jgi:adenylylsulfate kinase
MTGMSGAGKTTISRAAAKKLQAQGYKVELIDGDEYRKNVTKGLGFSREDRLENIHRLGFIGKVLSRNGVIAILAAINPYEEARQDLAGMGAKTVYIECGLEELKRRDPKGLYERALLPEGHPDKIENFTGISDPYQAPDNPDLQINTEEQEIEESVDKLIKFILDNSG